MDKVLLGRSLYHDKRLSGDETIACVSCHSFDHGGSEALKTSTGIRKQKGPINAPTVLNSSLNFRQFWDGRAADLKEQALGPVTNPLEMGAKWEDVLPKLAKDKAYKDAFAKLYDGKVNKENVVDAIAEYESSLITPSRFDKFLRGDKDAISQAEKDGYVKFKETGCISCHIGPGVGGTMYQKMGLVKDYFKARGGELSEADMGRYNVTKNEADKHFFKVPLLRNIELTPPYFHDGSVATLEEAVTIMARHQLGKELSEKDVASIVTFLKTLTGELPAHTKPDADASAAHKG
ncbi:MAG: cytochrome-c peroxidase [Myxococcales bacterium]|nr:MAG: cytochrome-c peroxidase [Myxococcales bacterium]